MATTPNMNLVLPTVSQTLGPPWATQLNAALGQVDSHNHATGQGVQVPTAGINVNADLPFGGFNAVGIRTVRLSPQSATLTLPADAGCVYVVAGDLWYNNGSGVAVQITSGAAIVGTPGSIGGLASPAAVTYTSIDTRFRFTSNANVNAQLDAGPVTIRSMVASANGVTLQSPNSLAANYAVTLWPALPGVQSIVTLDNLGALSTSTLFVVDGITITTIGSQFQVIGAKQNAANASATVRGNRSAGDAGADVVESGQVTRTAGLITSYQNPLGTEKAGVRWDGALITAVGAEQESGAAALKLGASVARGVEIGGSLVLAKSFSPLAGAQRPLNVAAASYVSSVAQSIPTGTPTIVNFATKEIDTGHWPPDLISATPSGSGGTLVTGTYTYVVTATTAAGETLSSNALTVSVTGPTGSVALSWTPWTSNSNTITGYKVYRNGAVFFAVTPAGTTTFTDTGAAGTAGSPPATNGTLLLPPSPSSTFFPPADGFYYVSACVAFNFDAFGAGAAAIYVFRQGAMFRVGEAVNAVVASAQQLLHVSALVYCTTAQYLNIEVIQNSGSAEPLVASSDRNWFSVARVPGS